jgi:two-component system sensor histidine kinase FlrB
MYLANEEAGTRFTESHLVAHAVNATALESAFNAFNQRSMLLEASYRQLQSKVETLGAELRASQSARHRELLEKERLGDRLRRLLEALPGAVVVLDGDGIIRERNSKASELLNRPLLGRAWAEVVQREFRGGRNAGGDLQLGDGRILSLARRRLQQESGEILLLTDVTESRRMADMLARHQRLSAIGEMTARLAHQIRTPLASAVLYASRLASSGDEADAGEKIVNRLRELDRMVNDMLRFAAGARHGDETVAAGDLLNEVADVCASQLDDGATLTVELADPAICIAANRDALQGALANLVSNAYAACGSDARIELGAFRDGQRICLTVSDNGHGIADELRERIFEPFFTTRPQGTGLGLAVVRSVAEAHGGEVLVESSAAGTTVLLCLPAGDAVAGDTDNEGDKPCLTQPS